MPFLQDFFLAGKKFLFLEGFRFLVGDTWSLLSHTAPPSLTSKAVNLNVLFFLYCTVKFRVACLA